jgi:hypothetical protein
VPSSLLVGFDLVWVDYRPLASWWGTMSDLERRIRSGTTSRAREWSQQQPHRLWSIGELLPLGRAFSLLSMGRGCG